MTPPRQIKPLGELLDIRNGFAFSSDCFNEEFRGIPLIRIRDLAKGTTTAFFDGPYDERYRVRKGDFLIGMDGEFRCYRWQGEEALLNQRVCRLQNFKEGVLPAFIYYGINDHLSVIESKTDFVTVKHISARQIASIQMRIPPLHEQERIVAILDAAEELRRLREQTDRRTTDLIPALFHEMFGDPRTNPKRWPVESLGGTAREKPNNGIFRKNSEYVKADVNSLPVVWVEDLFKYRTINEKIGRRIIPTNADISKYGLTFGDILFCRSSLKLDGIAFNNIYMGKDGATLFECHLIRVRPKLNIVSPVYLNYLLHQPHMRAIAKSKSKTATMTTIDQRALCSIPVLLPPLSLQEDFSARIACIQALEESQKASRCRLDDLFQSLLHRAFRGEL